MISPNTSLLKRCTHIGGRPGPATVMLLSALGAAPAVAQPSTPYYGPPWDGAWWMFFGPFTMLLFIAAIVAVVVLVVRWLAGPSHRGSGVPLAKTPRDVLQERFARGEIDKEEFEERRRILGV